MIISRLLWLVVENIDGRKSAFLNRLHNCFELVIFCVLKLFEFHFFLRIAYLFLGKQNAKCNVIFIVIVEIYFVVGLQKINQSSRLSYNLYNFVRPGSVSRLTRWNGSLVELVDIRVSGSRFPMQMLRNWLDVPSITIISSSERFK